MSLRCGISKSLDPVLIPNSFNFGVAARTTEPCLFVSATTASLVVNGQKNFFGLCRVHPYLLINCNHT